jgi:hypothetical protein
MYFIRGSLPWQGIEAPTKVERRKLITQTKIDTSPMELSKGHPSEFAVFGEYVRALGFEETPDYEYLRGLFRNVAVREGFANDGAFDWIGVARKVGEKSSE